MIKHFPIFPLKKIPIEIRNCHRSFSHFSSTIQLQQGYCLISRPKIARPKVQFWVQTCDGFHMYCTWSCMLCFVNCIKVYENISFNWTMNFSETFSRQTLCSNVTVKQGHIMEILLGVSGITERKMLPMQILWRYLYFENSTSSLHHRYSNALKEWP